MRFPDHENPPDNREISQIPENRDSQTLSRGDFGAVFDDTRVFDSQSRDFRVISYINSPYGSLFEEMSSVVSHDDIKEFFLPNRTEYFFKFDDKFEIHDHVKVLKQMGLLLGLDKGESTYEDIEKLKTMVPQQFWKYIECK